MNLIYSIFKIDLKGQIVFIRRRLGAISPFDLDVKHFDVIYVNGRFHYNVPFEIIKNFYINEENKAEQIKLIDNEIELLNLNEEFENG